MNRIYLYKLRLFMKTTELNYIDILNDNQVIKNYNRIDEINPYVFNHWLKHVKNVCDIMDRLCDKLGIVWEEKEALLIACAFHDVGQVDGVEEHGKKAKLFIINNFEEQLKNLKYYNDILEAIERHSELDNLNSSIFCVLLQFCDKMDFSRDRLEDNYRERFRYYCCEDIERIDFILDDNNFGIDIISNDIPNFKQVFLKENFPKRAIKTLTVLSSKLNKEPIIKNNWNVILDSNDFKKFITKNDSKIILDLDAFEKLIEE